MWVQKGCWYLHSTNLINQISERWFNPDKDQSQKANQEKDCWNTTKTFVSPLMRIFQNKYINVTIKAKKMTSVTQRDQLHSDLSLSNQKLHLSELRDRNQITHFKVLKGNWIYLRIRIEMTIFRYLISYRNWHLLICYNKCDLTRILWVILILWNQLKNLVLSRFRRVTWSQRGSCHQWLPKRKVIVRYMRTQSNTINRENMEYYNKLGSGNHRFMLIQCLVLLRRIIMLFRSHSKTQLQYQTLDNQILQTTEWAKSLHLPTMKQSEIIHISSRTLSSMKLNSKEKHLEY